MDEDEEVVDPKIAIDAKCLAQTSCSKALVSLQSRESNMVSAIKQVGPRFLLLR